MGLVSRYVGPQTFLDYLQGCVKPLAQRPMGSMPFSLLLGQEIWAESGKWEGLMFLRISCCLMSDESGHTHQQAPSRFLVGGKKLGQGSGDKLGEHPFPPPLPASALPAALVPGVQVPLLIQCPAAPSLHRGWPQVLHV